MTERIAVPRADLVAVVDACLGRLGLDGADLACVRDVLLYAQERGNPQGLLKIVERTVGRDPGAGPIAVVAQRGATLRLDGNRNPGMVVCMRAVHEAARLAARHGIAFVGTCNTASSTGAIGYYAEQLALQGLVGIVFAGSPKVMATAGGIDPVFGTNPIAIAVPTGGEPLVLDMATAATTWFSLIEARATGTAIRPGAAVDPDGAPTTDPAAAMAGAIAAFGGHKGAGLALMVEILTGPLVGAGIVGDHDAATNRGAAFIAIAPSFVGDAAVFRATVDRLCATIRGGRIARGADAIALPGEHGRAHAAAQRAAGTIAVERGLYETLLEMADPPSRPAGSATPYQA